MRTQIRHGVFETNSSSTHAICIAKEVEIKFPKELYFEFGEFGWERDTLDTTMEKASYLYTGMYENNRNEEFLEIVEILKKKGIDVTYEIPNIENRTYGYGDDKDKEYEYCTNCGYVDHADRLKEFINDVVKSKTKLFNFLFSDLSFILTGNDNDNGDGVERINVSYPYHEYFKGN